MELEERLVYSTQLVVKTAHLETPLQEVEELGLAAVMTTASLPRVWTAVLEEVRRKKVEIVMETPGLEHRAGVRAVKTLQAGGRSMAMTVGLSGQLHLRLAPVVVEPVLPVDTSQTVRVGIIGSPATVEAAGHLVFPVPRRFTRVEAAEPLLPPVLAVLAA